MTDRETLRLIRGALMAAVRYLDDHIPTDAGYEAWNGYTCPVCDWRCSVLDQTLERAEARVRELITAHRRDCPDPPGDPP